jgi:predicted Zn-dependent protease
MKRTFFSLLFLLWAAISSHAQYAQQDSFIVIEGDIMRKYEPGPSLQYGLSGSKWNKTTIGYYVYNTSNHLTAAQRLSAIQGAFQKWEDASRLTFYQATTPSAADIKLKWVTGDHGDGVPLQENDGHLAHTVDPPPGGGSLAGEVHFNDYYNFTMDNPGINLNHVALHEIGHALGLDHSTLPTAVMYQPSNGVLNLTADDIQGINVLYGWPPIGGPESINCYTNGTTYSVPPGLFATYSWTVSSNLQILSGQGTSSIVVNPNSWQTHPATITLNGTLSGSTATTTITRQINIGVPNNLIIYNQTNNIDGTITFEVAPGLPLSQCEYLWEETSGRSDYIWSTSADNYHTTFRFNGHGTYNLKCTPWLCNVGTPATITVIIPYSQYSASASGKQVVISSLEGSSNMLSSAGSQVTYTLVYVVTGAVAASGQISSAGGTLNFGSLPAGIYILALDTGGDKPETFRIVLQ